MADAVDVADEFMMMAERAFKQRDDLARALSKFLATDETMEGILWDQEPDTALVKITIPLGQYREARRLLKALVGGSGT